jgi:hypothetical protein
MKVYGGVDVFLTSELTGGEWATSRSDRFTLEEKAPGTHWVGGWVGSRTSLDDVEKRKILPLLELQLRTLGRPARILFISRHWYMFLSEYFGLPLPITIPPILRILLTAGAGAVSPFEAPVPMTAYSYN